LTGSCGHKKTGPKAGFFIPESGITWQRRQRERQALQQREQQALQQREQQLPGQQQAQLPSEQQLREPERRQALQRGLQLLLFCRKRSWKQPEEQPEGRNISFDFPLLRI